jgi:tetratricopeptide (TPR) repeat protein
MLDVDWIVLRREASELIHGSPFSPDDRLRRSRAFAELKEIEKAEAECALAVKALPDSPRGHVACAWVLAQKGRQEQAVRHLEMARPLMDQQWIAIARDVEFWRIYGETLSLLKRHEEASRAIPHAIAAQSVKVLGPSPSNADRGLLSDLHASLADALEAAGRPEESRAARARLTMFTNVFGRRPSIRGVDDLLDDDAPESRDVDARIAGIDQLLADNKTSLADHDPIRLHLSARLHQRRAEVLEDGGRPGNEILDAISAAHEQYERLLAIDPSDGAAAAALADLLLSRSAVPWTPFEPVKLSSKSGTALSLQSDGSILASGVNPIQDTYTVMAKPTIARIAAVRLEALPHPTLPRGGSGRDRNGSFVLSEFTVNTTRPGKPPGQDPVPVKLTSATASFHRASYNAREFTIQQAIDGQLATGWDAWPLVYRRQEGVFELEPDSEHTTGSTLVIQLTSQGSAEWPPTLGRFRLSVSADPTAFELERRRFAIMNKNLTDPWERLALAHFVLGDQSALDKLLERHPASASFKGDLRAVAQDWHGAVAEYTTAITPETKDAKLLAKRAEAYEKLKQWDLAVADWTRASQQQPDVAFERFKPAGAQSWHFYLLNAAAAGSMEVAEGALVFTTTIATGTAWHVQALQAPLQLDNGAEYVIRFKMKSPDSCAVTLGAQINQPDYHPIGLNETFVPPTEFRGYEFAFVAHDVVPGNNAIAFNLGMNRGKVMIKEIVILKK